jgi:hypothetical protein
LNPSLNNLPLQSILRPKEDLSEIKTLLSELGQGLGPSSHLTKPHEHSALPEPSASFSKHLSLKSTNPSSRYPSSFHNVAIAPSTIDIKPVVSIANSPLNKLNSSKIRPMLRDPFVDEDRVGGSPAAEEAANLTLREIGTASEDFKDEQLLEHGDTCWEATVPVRSSPVK